MTGRYPGYSKVGRTEGSVYLNPAWVKDSAARLVEIVADRILGGNGRQLCKGTLPIRRYAIVYKPTDYGAAILPRSKATSPRAE